MLAQWISWAASKQFRKARTEPLITFGSAPLDVHEFRGVVLGQLGETRLDVAIEADLAGPTAHARALDADSTGPLTGIHRRVGATILFESSGGQVDKVAHLPELGFALGGPGVETTSINNAASALESAGFFIRKIGTDGYRIHHQATLKKVVSDRRASLDEKTEIRPAVRKLVETEFKSSSTLPVAFFPEDSAAIQDSPRLTLVVLDPDMEWTGPVSQDTEAASVAELVCRWTRERGTSPRLCPGSLVWCVKKPGRQLRDRVEHWLAWKRVEREVREGVLGAQFERADRAAVQSSVRDAEEAARDEVWSGYRFVALADPEAGDGLRIIDLGAGHSSANGTLCGRIVAALKSEALLNESVGAGYIDRHWPPAFKESGAWPLASLRQSFVGGALTRLIDPDTVLRHKIVEFVTNGDFGLASGAAASGYYDRLWHRELIGPEEVAFESGVFLLTREKAEELRSPASHQASEEPQTGEDSEAAGEAAPKPELAGSSSEYAAVTLHIAGHVPPEVWNRLGTKIIPKLRAGEDLRIGIEFSVRVSGSHADATERELRQALEDLNLAERVRVTRT